MNQKIEIDRYIPMSKQELITEIMKLEIRLQEEYRMTNELIQVLNENNIQHFYAKRDLEK